MESTNPHETLAAEQARMTVNTAMRFITAKQRRAIELVYLDGMSTVEGSKTLGVRRDTFGDLLRRGLDAMRGYLQSNGIPSLAAIV